MLAAERGAAAVEALHRAYHPQAVPYPSRIEYSAGNAANARTATESFLDANTAAIRELEGNGIRLIHQSVHLNGIVWSRLLDNLDEDLAANGETWFRWKLGRQLGLGSGLSDTTHQIDVMGDLASSLCAGIDTASGPSNDAFAAICSVVGDMYQARFESRHALREGRPDPDASRVMSESYSELRERYPADSNPLFSTDAARAFLYAEGDLSTEILGSRDIDVRVLPWIEDAEELHAFARTCPEIPSEHIELPTILEELGLTPEDGMCEIVYLPLKPIPQLKKRPAH